MLAGMGGALGDELRWKEDWKAASCRGGQKAKALEGEPPRAGMAAGKSSWVKPRESVRPNPVCVGFEASEVAGEGTTTL